MARYVGADGKLHEVVKPRTVMGFLWGILLVLWAFVTSLCSSGKPSTTASSSRGGVIARGSPSTHGAAAAGGGGSAGGGAGGGARARPPSSNIRGIGDLKDAPCGPSGG